MPQGYRSDVYAKAYSKKKPINTHSVSPTTASAGVTSKRNTGRPVPQYKEREGRNKSDDALRAEVLRTLGAAMRPPGGGAPTGLMPSGTTAPLNMPQVPIEPVMGNPYKGVDQAIGRSVQASAKRSKGDVAAARQALKGRADPGAQITGSFDAQAAGMAAEAAAQGTSLRNAARAGFASEELRYRSESYKNRFDARSQQIKNDTELMGGQGLSPSMAQQLEAEGIDSTQFMNNPMGAMITLGRARYARRNEASQLPPTAWAQAAQYGLQPPNTFGSREDFYWNLGQAKAGTYGGGQDAVALLQALQASGLLKGMSP